MKGNWNTSEASSRRITVEHCGLAHSPATPAWNIADRIVKEEPTEDKNNDSGVSPGHYTSNSASPRSRRSSSTANGSLSPGSATSQDFNAMQYEYSPHRRLFKPEGGSPINFDLGNVHRNVSASSYDDRTINERIERTEPIRTIDDSSSPMISDNSKDGESMRCPVCSFTTVHRIQFNEHLVTHCSQKCDSNEFLKSGYNQGNSIPEDGLNSPSQGDRSEQEFDETDEPGLRVPRVNSQGKVKTFRCKQCNFVAVTKLEFWEHSRGHIKADKLLTCPKCPFVTEYKHHLEYHLRNHFGSKPFKCDKCPYSCVNKSMLNSHLKSHSNVYQYRCADCSYATKYCHSLKLHLRKYVNHKPAMVLNPDGSPNPVPIIDIYGTRRGPKQKPVKTEEDSSTNGNTAILKSAMLSSLATANDMKSFTNEMLPPQLNVSLAYGQIFNQILRFHDNNNEQNGTDLAKGTPTIYDPYNDPGSYHRDKIEDRVGMDCKSFPQGFFTNDSTISQPTTIRYSPNESSPMPLISVSPSTTPSIESPVEISNVVSPLDLSKSENNSRTKAHNDSPRTSGTSRRKGKAFKLDRLAVERDSDNDSEIPKERESLTTSDAVRNDCYRDTKVSANSNVSTNSNANDDHAMEGEGNSCDYACHYCDITFGNVVMYTMHMGYHGYNNPYTCNMCGQQCTDKVSFFLHIARSSHA